MACLGDVTRRGGTLVGWLKDAEVFPLLAHFGVLRRNLVGIQAVSEGLVPVEVSRRQCLLCLQLLRVEAGR